MNKFLPQNWNDVLSIVLLLLIPLIWILNGKGVISIAPEVSGALIVAWTLVIQFYFRKSPTEK